MAVKFTFVNGGHDDLLRTALKNVDLVIEGSWAQQEGYLDLVRKVGYEGKYVHTDILSKSLHSKIPDVPVKPNYWQYGGNCFIDLDMKPVFVEFAPSNPLFLTANTLSNGLFDDGGFPHGKKLPRDRVSIKDAVGCLTDAPYKTQFHVAPAGFGALVGAEALRKYGDRLEKIPRFEVFPGVALLDVYKVGVETHVHTERFREFVEESAKRGWHFTLPNDIYDVMLMTRA